MSPISTSDSIFQIFKNLSEMMVYYTFDWSILQIPEYSYVTYVDVIRIWKKVKNGFANSET